MSTTHGRWIVDMKRRYEYDLGFQANYSIARPVTHRIFGIDRHTTETYRGTVTANNAARICRALNGEAEPAIASTNWIMAGGTSNSNVTIAELCRNRIERRTAKADRRVYRPRRAGYPKPPKNPRPPTPRKARRRTRK